MKLSEVLGPSDNRAFDGCEWDPDVDLPSTTFSDHYLTARAEVIVGADGQWRLCRGCAALPRFNKFTTRRPITRGQGENDEEG